MTTQRKIIRVLTYFSFVLILPIIWYFVERRWLLDMNQKIQDKKIEIEKKSQKVALYWSSLDQFLMLNHPITPVPDLKGNLNLYRHAIREVWDFKKNPASNLQWTIAQFQKLTKLTDFLQEIEQNFQEYNSDVLLFNQSFKKWPNWIIGYDIKLKPFALIGENDLNSKK